MAGISIEQAWALASDTAGLQAAAEEFARTATQVTELGELITAKAQKLTEVADALETDASHAAAQVGAVLIQAGWVPTALDSIGAQAHSATVAALGAYCEEQVKDLTTRAKALGTVARNTASTLSGHRAGVDEIVSTVSSVRARIVDAL
ncbi:MAG: hypothetical protein JOZ47_08835 [Kutzneria sp.]|nr:hypothetical protein [Kutzneria sp.]